MHQWAHVIEVGSCCFPQLPGSCLVSQGIKRINYLPGSCLVAEGIAIKRIEGINTYH